MVPKDWELMRLGKVAETVTSGSRDWAQYYSESGSKFIRMTNLRRDGIYLKLDDLKYVDVNSNSSDGKRTSLQHGDILISITAELGKIGWIPEQFGEAYINQHTALVRLKKNIVSSLFVAYVLSSKHMHYVINSLNDAGAKAGLNLPTIRGIPVLLPPVPEQRKIAKILCTWDQAIETSKKMLINSQQQKNSLMQQLLTGKKRFPGFSGEWKYARFDELFKISNDKRIQVKSSEYLEHGSVPIVDQGQKIIAGFTNRNKVYSSVPVIIFGDHTRIVKWIDFSFAPGADGTQILKTKELLHLKLGYYLLGNVDIPNLGYSRHMRELRETDFKFPVDKLEQQKIASVLSAADKEIEAIQQKLTCLKQEKKALMQQLLTGNRRVKVDEKEISQKEAARA